MEHILYVLSLIFFPSKIIIIEVQYSLTTFFRFERFHSTTQIEKVFLDKNKHGILIITWDIDVWVKEEFGKITNKVVFCYNLSEVSKSELDDVSAHKYL